MTGLCFVGTDTGVGKTFLTAAVARLLRRQGHSVGVCKPVATGATQIAGRWRSDDTLQLADAAGLPHELDRITPWTFPDPLAPHVAARRQGVTLRLSDLVQAVRDMAADYPLILAEGVGGLLCPLTETETVADWAARLALPLVIVARRSLGTLNHTLLTLEVAHSRGLPVAGIVINETTPPNSLAEETNPDELRRRIDVPLLAVVPYQHDGKAVPAALESVDWRRLASMRKR
jgi:dethiobiotin synthetase